MDWLLAFVPCNHCGRRIEVSVSDNGNGSLVLQEYPSCCQSCDGDFDPSDYEGELDGIVLQDG